MDDNDTPDDTVSIELRVTATTANGEECRYDVTLRVPRQLATVHGEHEHNVFENVDPRATIDFSVGVATTTRKTTTTRETTTTATRNPHPRTPAVRHS